MTPTAPRCALHARHAPFIWMPSTQGANVVRVVTVPLWIPLIVVAVPTGVLWSADRRATRREMAGRCPTCGYDRSGLADAKCPECGTVPAPAA
jgi:hypothetical protein